MKTNLQSARRGQRSRRSSAQSSTRSGGFTLVEMMVAVALFAVLMIVVFVPLTQAARFLSVGRTRAGLQQSANQTMSQLQRDLQRAIYVYPNDDLPGITDKSPYTNTPGTSKPPYYQSSATGSPARNTTRIDMLLPELDANGAVKYPITPAKYIVTYYAARLNTTKPADAYTNPVVLIRAQYPYLDRSNKVLDASNPNTFVPIDVSNTRYNTGAANGWLIQGGANLYPDEFDLSGFCKDQTALPSPAPASPDPIVVGSLAVVTPRNIALVTPKVAPKLDTATPANSQRLNPNTSFNCADVNGDGKIDQVTVNLTITQFDQQVTNGGNNMKDNVGDNRNFQKFTLSQSINLPNIR